MKPDPYLTRQVFQRRAWRPSQYAFVGDSVTDVQVSRSTSWVKARTPAVHVSEEEPQRAKRPH